MSIVNSFQSKRLENINGISLANAHIVNGIYTFAVNGTINNYTVRINPTTRRISCDCKDNDHNTLKFKCICKHSCYVLCNVLNLFRVNKNKKSVNVTAYNEFDNTYNNTAYFGSLVFSPLEMNLIAHSFKRNFRTSMCNKITDNIGSIMGVIVAAGITVANVALYYSGKFNI
ncbi:MAG: hypothetical protein Faunusvirus3_20 [Faunusvirus sp.]|jgi:hypothetical protein|uniref:SWIM-type domain-containing protein n=1 Tax=Faunusvirus sp. TaxID=2487766 RepID=A0A3G4ZWB4_9VIRU|nr:MAG: hypothetical protein Faunusvirus3_20 [Faunusvirus sp.]